MYVGPSYIKDEKDAFMPRVLNKRTDEIPPDAVYGGRPAWPQGLGNPYRIGPDGDRNTVAAKHKAAFLSDPVWVAVVKQYKGRDWACFCAPAPCHCDVYLEGAN